VRHHWFRRIFSREKNLRFEDMTIMMIMIIMMTIIIIIGFTKMLQYVNKTKREDSTTKRK
jgi:hypothetical protein